MFRKLTLLQFQKIGKDFYILCLNDIFHSVISSSFSYHRPKNGEIVVQGAQMRYRDGPLVLKGVDFKIMSGQKIGVAGRTGYVLDCYDVVIHI